MKTKTRKNYSATFKTKVAVEAIKERETINQIAGRYGVHPNMVTTWKNLLIESLPNCFERKARKDSKNEALVNELYQKIGKLDVQVDWLKKKYESIQG